VVPYEKGKKQGETLTKRAEELKLDGFGKKEDVRGKKTYQDFQREASRSRGRHCRFPERGERNYGAKRGGGGRPSQIHRRPADLWGEWGW